MNSDCLLKGKASENNYDESQCATQINCWYFLTTLYETF